MAGKINKPKVINAAQKYVQKGQYDRAIREYSRIVEEDPRDVRIWLKIGDLCARKGSKQEAIDTYLKVAEFYSEQGFYLKAIAVYKQVLKIDSTRIDVNIRLAELYKQLGLLNDAMQQYEVVANHHTQRGHTKDALAALREIVNLAPENVASRIKLAELYSKEQMRGEAVEEFAKAAEYLRANNRLDDFIKVAERLIFHDPQNLALVKELARLYLRRGDPRRALQKLQVAFKVDPRDEETMESLAQAFQDLGQLQKTVSVLKELAHIQSETGHDRRAAETYTRILDLAPNDDEARRALAAVDTGAGRRAGPLAPVESAELAAPAALGGFVPNPRGLDVSYEEVIPTADAEERYDAPRGSSLHHDPPESRDVPLSGADLDDDVARILTESDVYIKYGLHDRAVEHLRQVFGRDPNNVVVRLKLRDLYVQLDRYAEAALELIAVARYVGPTDPHGALNYLDEALRLDPNSSAARELNAELQARIGPQHALSAHDLPLEIADAGDYHEVQDFEEVMPIDLDAGDIVEEIPIEGSDLIEIRSDDDAEPYEETSRRTFEEAEDAGIVVDYSDQEGSGSIEVIGETTDTLGRGTPSSEIIALPADVRSIESPAQSAARQHEVDSGLDDDLEEAEFFVQQGLYAEAEAILQELSERSPANPIVQAKLADLLALKKVSASEDRGVASHDLAAELAAELEQDIDGALPEEESTDYNVDDVFNEFKRGVEGQVSDEDSDTHYDLGIAYREMGLLDDAMAEFKTAMRSREKEVLCHMMIGICQVEKGLIGEAINQFKTGLYVEGITERETIALYFELGQAYEVLEDHPEALYYFEKVSKRDPTFRDVVGRVNKNRLVVGNGGHGLGRGEVQSLESSDPPDLKTA